MSITSERFRCFEGVKSDESEDLIGIFMGASDWEVLVGAMEYLSDFTSTPLKATSDHMALIGDSISDVLDSYEIDRKLVY